MTPAPTASPSLTVVTVFWGTKYDPSYVYKLKEAVALNLLHQHTFVVLTESPELFPDLETIQSPEPDAWGWWQKILLFKPGVVPGDLALFLDLDSAVVGPLDLAVDFPVKPGEVVMVPSTVPGKQPASPAMLWIPGTCDDLWLQYALRGWRACKAEWRGGDQRFITNIRRMQGIKEFPLGMFKSYKEGLEHKYPRHSHRPVVIVYHGKPKPLDLPVGDPFRNIWEFPRRAEEPPSPHQ